MVGGMAESAHPERNRNRVRDDPRQTGTHRHPSDVGSHRQASDVCLQAQNGGGGGLVRARRQPAGCARDRTPPARHDSPERVPGPAFSIVTVCWAGLAPPASPATEIVVGETERIGPGW